MKVLLGLVGFVYLWTVIGLLLQKAGIEHPVVYMFVGALLGMFATAVAARW